MRNGAADYLLKNNLACLAPALPARGGGGPSPSARGAWRTPSCCPAPSSVCTSWPGHLQTQVELERVPAWPVRSTTTSAAR